MIYTTQTKKALSLCFEAHKDQTDKSGMPYVFHPFYLAQQMDNETETITALLHDVVEDTDYTFEDLRSMGFGDDVISALKLLTHDDSDDYFAYIEKIKTNPLAKKVKLADLRHNSDLSRFDEVTHHDLMRHQKYKKAIEILEG